MKKDQTTIGNYQSNVGYFFTQESKYGNISVSSISDKEEVLIEFKKALDNLKDGEKIVVKATENFYLGNNQ
jgi:hypothetical protein